MATLADSLVSSSARKLAMRMRPDLSARQHRYQGRVYWVVKEPVGLNYFRFQEEEFAILRWLDGHASLDDLKEKFEDEFPPQKIGVEELQQFIGMLHKSGLIIANVPGQGAQLKKRRDERKKKELLGKFTNLLSIRFKGIDPDRLLSWMHPKLKWIYTRWCVTSCLVLFAAALTLVLANYGEFQSKLPAFHQFFNLKNAVYLSIALGVTKVIHEFGHGLTCKHFGGECHEMGVMVLCLTPCLYCNVSDSWMLPNKWHRAAIGAGGMFVELVIASVCTFIWWNTQPGMLNYLCLSTMFVCSVSTLIFNSNPLLRYDGYYILSDLIEIPNLRQKSSEILQRKLGEWCLGLERPEDPFLPQRRQIFFALYSVAAAVYRWVVVFSILWFFYEIFKPYKLEVIGRLIGLVAMYGLFVAPLWKLGKFFYVPGRIDKVKKHRLYATLGVLSLLVAAVVFIPLPYRVYSVLEIKPRDAAMVVVVEPGTVAEISPGVELGASVFRGQTLAQLSNLDLDAELTQKTGQRELQFAQLESLKGLQFDNPAAQEQIDRAEKALASYDKEIEEVRAKRQSLVLTAPADGVVLPAPSQQPKPKGDRELPEWSGTPFDVENGECFLNSNAVFCQIGDPAKMEAHLVIDQSEIEFIEEGQQVEIQLEALGGRLIRGTITKVARADMKSTPASLTNKAGGDLATKTDESGVEKPLSVSYEASVPIDNPSGLLRQGLRGTAKIHATRQTLWQRVARYVQKTWDFKL